MEVLSRTIDMSEATEDDIERLKRRVSCVRYWLNGFAPDMVKFSVLQSISPDIELSMNEKVFFQALVKRMNDCVWDTDTITGVVSDIAKASPIGSKGGYKALYKILIGKTAGPRLGPFLASMDQKFVVNRLIQASQ